MIPEERCGAAQTLEVPCCGNPRLGMEDGRDHCENTSGDRDSCCWYFINEALNDWGKSRIDIGDGYDEVTWAQGISAWKVFQEHERRCGFRQDAFEECRRETLWGCDLPDRRNRLAPGGHQW